MRSALSLFAVLFSTCASGTEIVRLHIDLDGNGRPEVVSLNVEPVSKNGDSMATLRVGKSTLRSKFFTPDREVPDIRVIRIDRSSPKQQLLVALPDPTSCIYEVFAYTNETLKMLLSHDAGASCKPPQPLGNGRLQTSTWAGFWDREEWHQLSQDGNALVLQQRTEYRVHAAGAAGVGLSLGGSNCGTREIAAGTYLWVRTYDSAKKRFLVEAAGGGCGWLPERDLDQSVDKVRNLPWAG